MGTVIATLSYRPAVSTFSGCTLRPIEQPVRSHHDQGDQIKVEIVIISNMVCLATLL